jgi:hypothetical protein
MLECLEDRTTPATILVTSEDDGAPFVDGKVTLREAIMSINNQDNINADVNGLNYGTDDTIIFATLGKSSIRIQLSEKLTLSKAVTIDGYLGDQELARPNTQPLGGGIDTILRVEVAGGGIDPGNAHNGFVIEASNCVLRGLAINNCMSAVLIKANAQNTVIEGNFIGTNRLGTDDESTFVGVTIEGRNNTVGGTTAAARNLISGNTTAGVSIDDNLGGNKIYGNYIGTDKDGTTAIGNYFGVRIQRSRSNFVGGDVDGAGNLISGNTSNVVYISTTGGAKEVIAADLNIVQGNWIGTTRTVTAALANGEHGVEIRAGSKNTIGGTTAAARNVISGNPGFGVWIRMEQGDESSANNNVVLGNRIGTNLEGTGAIANLNGVGITNGDNNTIGQEFQDPNVSNLISGNTAWGVVIRAANVNGQARGTGNNVWSNYIGTDLSGNAKLGNGSGGVSITWNSAGQAQGLNVIGGSPGKRNVIGANGGPDEAAFANWRNHGIFIKSLDKNQIQGNYIGLGADGETDVGNARSGIWLQQSNETTIGGVGDAKNYISWNGYHAAKGVANLTLSGSNKVGESVSGKIAPNGRSLAGEKKVGGIDFEGNNNIFIGEVVANNEGSGFSVVGDGNQIIGSYIFANEGHGIEITGSGNIIQGNSIGTDDLGGFGLGNLGHGIYLNGAIGTLIGGDEYEGNVITANEGDGVSVVDGEGSSSGNSILSNSIWDNGGLGIDLGDDGVTVNDLPTDADTGPNGLQNFPMLSQYGMGFLVELYSTPSTPFVFQFFHSDSPDPSGFGEGQSGGGDFVWYTDSTGYASFLIQSVEVGKWLTATATNLNTGDTSEFSNAIQVPGGLGMMIGGGGFEAFGDGSGDDSGDSADGDAWVGGQSRTRIVPSTFDDTSRFVLYQSSHPPLTVGPPSKNTAHGSSRPWEPHTSPSSILEEFLYSQV